MPAKASCRPFAKCGLQKLLDDEQCLLRCEGTLTGSVLWSGLLNVDMHGHCNGQVQSIRGSWCAGNGERTPSAAACQKAAGQASIASCFHCNEEVDKHTAETGRSSAQLQVIWASAECSLLFKPSAHPLDVETHVDQVHTHRCCNSHVWSACASKVVLGGQHITSSAGMSVTVSCSIQALCLHLQKSNAAASLQRVEIGSAEVPAH